MTRGHLMRHAIGRVLLMLAGVIALVILPQSPAFAQGGAQTLITILSADSLESGHSGTIVARLTTTEGAPLPGVALDFALGNTMSRWNATDANGSATFTVTPNVAPGTYRLTISFAGSRGFQPTSITQEMTVAGDSEVRLQIMPLDNVPLNVNAVITAHLTDAVGQPLAHEHLTLFVDGVHAEQADTDRNGNAYLRIGKDLTAGQHKLVVVYDGSPRFAPASATQVTGIRALDIEIHTIPVIEGAQFKFQGKVYAADKDGIVRIPVSQAGTYQVEALPYQSPQGDIQAEFSIWDDQTFTPYHDITVPSLSPAEAGYTVSYLVKQSFVDLDGKPVDAARVDGLTFKRSDGEMLNFHNGEAHWLPVSHVLRRVFGLAESPFLYSLMSVTVHGTNVVSAQQQRFLVQPQENTWQVQLLLYAANFHSHDMLFGFPLGSSVKLEYPDGTKVISPMDGSATTQIRSLPRGDYKVSVNTWFGISPVSSLAMSRNQDVELPIVSYLDILTLVLVAVLIGPGVLLLGQPGLRRALRDGSLWRMLRNPRELAKIW